MGSLCCSGWFKAQCALQHIGASPDHVVSLSWEDYVGVEAAYFALLER